MSTRSYPTRRLLVVLAVLATLTTLLAAPAQSQEESPPADDAVTATTAAPAVPATTGALPVAPTGVVGESVDGGAVIRWEPVEAEPAITGYVVRLNGTVAEEVEAEATEFTDTGLLAEETYRYTVAARNDLGEGPPSEAVTVVPTADTTPGFSTREAAGTFAAQTERRVYTYSIATRGRIGADVEHFRAHVAHTLNDPRGWSLGGSIEFRHVSSGGHFTVWLAEAGTVPSFSSVCSANWSCRVGRNVIINETRWRFATPSWRASGGTIDSYQHYVVVHETGHWLGFGHSNCPGVGQLAPTMQQQSKGLQGCRHNGWPVGGERSAVSRRTGAPALAVGRSSASTRWGRSGDVVLACDWNGDGLDTQAIFRDGTWYVRDGLTSGRARSFKYGRAGDTPVCGNWNGRGGDGIGVVRGRQWYLRNSATGGPSRYRFSYGAAISQPVTGDWDGRGGDGIGRVYNGRWLLRNSLSAGPVQWKLRYGRGGDQFVPGDWDADGTDEPGVVRGSRWYQPTSWWPGSGGLVVRYGRGTPLSGRWDGLAVDKPGRFGRGNWAFARFSPTP